MTEDFLQKTAYFREYNNGQCELVFKLKKKFEFGALNEEVVAKRQATDTVESLLNHIVNKIKKSIKDMKEDAEIEIDVSLKDLVREKNIKPNTVLTNLARTAISLEFSIFEQRFYVLINAPFVKEIKLPELIFSNVEVSPNKYVVPFAERNKCQFAWFKSKNKKDWVLLSTKQFAYKVVDDDIDYYLMFKCVPCNDIMTGEEVKVISANVVQKMKDIPRCPFEDRHKYTESTTEGKTFRLVSYNVLSERYTDNAQFPYCPLNALSSDYRKQLISKELLGYKADIMCLQEMDLTLFNCYYRDLFKKKGYMSFFHRKGWTMSEGLAIFFLTSRFTKVHDYQIVFRDEIVAEPYKMLFDCLQSNKTVYDDFMKQRTSLHVTVLKMEHHVIILANTHLFYRPDAKLLRLLQISVATGHLALQRKAFAHLGRVSVVVCGDFNSHPDSAVVQFMTQGKIKKNHEVFKEAKINGTITHPFGFQSVYETPKYTNYTDEFKGCLDYIFVQSSRINVQSVVPLFDDEELSKYTGLPNEVFPSDHLALVSDLNLL